MRADAPAARPAHPSPALRPASTSFDQPMAHASAACHHPQPCAGPLYMAHSYMAHSHANPCAWHTLGRARCGTSSTASGGMRMRWTGSVPVRRSAAFRSSRPSAQTCEGGQPPRQVPPCQARRPRCPLSAVRARDRARACLASPRAGVPHNGHSHLAGAISTCHSHRPLPPVHSFPPGRRHFHLPLPPATPTCHSYRPFPPGRRATRASHAKRRPSLTRSGGGDGDRLGASATSGGGCG